MRGGQRTRHVEEEESAFISMTDMTVSFLFVIMILLAFFATQIAPKDTVPKVEYEKVRKDLEERDAQVASLLSQLEVFRMKGSESLPWLMSERDRLTKEVAALTKELERTREAVGAKAGEDVPYMIQGLRDEIARLHRMLDAARESNPIERYNYRVAELRGQLLQRLKAKIVELDPTIEVEISRNKDALEFKGDGLFLSSSEVPTPIGRHKMEVIASVLKDDIGCFVLGQRSELSEKCNPAMALIEALQVEGHTDSSGPDVMNMELSSRRGSSIYTVMTSVVPDLVGLQNLRGQPILSVAGYGEGRPIYGNDTKEGRDANRRIDLRFIMFAPTEQGFVPQRIEDLPRVMKLLRGEVVP